MPRQRDRSEPVESVTAREQLERRWFTRMHDVPALGHLVTGARNQREPYHRWLHYKQAFAPQLVREFLRQAEGWIGDLPLLDPFSGSGTTVIEAARQQAPAIGVEALAVLAFLTRERALDDPPTLPDPIPDPDDPAGFAAAFSTPAQRVLALAAWSRRFDSDGKPLRKPPAITESLRSLRDEMAADLEAEALPELDVRRGDARRLDDLPDASCGGLLTSPPYLSRHDYTRITRPLGELYACWQPDEVALDDDRAVQVRAHPRARPGDITRTKHPAVLECVKTLRDRGEQRLARVVEDYFADMKAMLQTAARVLAPGAPAWIVIGGAQLAEIYIPADLLVLELAERAGFTARRVCRARDLHHGGRQLGGLTAVAPRETLLMLRAPR